MVYGIGQLATLVAPPNLRSTHRQSTLIPLSRTEKHFVLKEMTLEELGQHCRTYSFFRDMCQEEGAEEGERVLQEYLHR